MNKEKLHLYQFEICVDTEILPGLSHLKREAIEKRARKSSRAIRTSVTKKKRKKNNKKKKIRGTKCNRNINKNTEKKRVTFQKERLKECKKRENNKRIKRKRLRKKRLNKKRKKKETHKDDKIENITNKWRESCNGSDCYIKEHLQSNSNFSFCNFLLMFVYFCGL